MSCSSSRDLSSTRPGADAPKGTWSQRCIPRGHSATELWPPRPPFPVNAGKSCPIDVTQEPAGSRALSVYPK